MKRSAKRSIVGLVLLAVAGAVGWMFYTRTAMSDPGSQDGSQGGSDVGQGDGGNALGDLWRSFANLFRKRENRR